MKITGGKGVNVVYDPVGALSINGKRYQADFRYDHPESEVRRMERSSGRRRLRSGDHREDTCKLALAQASKRGRAILGRQH